MLIFCTFIYSSICQAACALKMQQQAVQDETKTTHQQYDQAIQQSLKRGEAIEEKKLSQDNKSHREGLLTTLHFPYELQQLINEYCYSPLDFLQCLYQKQCPQDESYITSIALSADGKTIACSSNFAIIFKDTYSQQCITQGIICFLPYDTTTSILSVAISGDGKTIASGSSDNAINLWNRATQKCTATLIGHTDFVTAVAISTDGKSIVSGSSDQTIKIWDITTQRCIATLRGHCHNITAVALSVDGKTIVSGSDDKTVKIWDAVAQKCTATLEQSDEINSIALSTDGKIIIFGSKDEIIKTIKIWDIATNKCSSVFQGIGCSIRPIAVSADNMTIACVPHHRSIQMLQCNQLLFSQLLQLPYEQLYALKLILNILNDHFDICEPKYINYYLNFLLKTWAKIPMQLQEALQAILIPYFQTRPYFFKNYLNISSAIQIWSSIQMQHNEHILQENLEETNTPAPVTVIADEPQAFKDFVTLAEQMQSNKVDAAKRKELYQEWLTGQEKVGPKAPGGL